METLNIIKLALTAIAANKGRSFLTMLGIIIGVASVIIIISVGAGAQSLIYAQIKSLGSNLIGVLPGKGGDSGPPASVYGVNITTLTYEDALAMVEGPQKVPHLAGAAAFAIGQGTATYQNKTVGVAYNGTMASYPQIIDMKLEGGRFINEHEEKNLAKVAVLGSEIKKDLFGDSDPVGKVVKLDNEKFQIIGYFAPKGAVAFQNFDARAYVPISTAQKILLGQRHVNRISAKVDDDKYVQQVIEDMRAVLRIRHKIRSSADDDFTVISADQALSAIGGVTDAVKFVLAAVAAISLLVGGIGIMNIMLVIVAERTREIGLRKALGAHPSNIRNQFLVEAIVVTGVGGIIGILLGMAVTALAAIVIKSLGYSWDLLFSADAIAAGFLISVGIGIFFGYFPARRASRLQAIEALRHE